MPGIEHNMEDIDDEILALTIDFIDQAHADGKPFFVWLNPTRMHVFTHLNDQYEGMRNSENEWTIEEAGMAQFDDVVGAVMAHLEQLGITDNTIIGVTTDNGTENFTWPDGGQTPFAGGKGMVQEGGFRVPMILRWPGHVEPNQVINGVISGLDWFPTFVAAAGNPNITEELLAGKEIGGTTYRVHLDGYDQTAMLTTGAESARNEVWYFAESNLGAARIGNYKYTFLEQPDGWFGPKEAVGWPGIINLAPRSVRAHDSQPVAVCGGMVGIRILAFRLCPAGSRQARRDRHRLPADAGRCQLQSGGGQGEAPSSAGRARPVVGSF